MSERIKLLVVDDEERFLKVLAQRLGLRDFDVLTATSGPEALELAEAHEIDLALLDLKMPGMGGDEVLERLKQQHPLVEVVILTGHGSIDSAVATTKAGAYMYLQKPTETEELMRVLKEAYQKRVQRKLAVTEEKLKQLTNMSLSESPLEILRRLKQLDKKGA